MGDSCRCVADSCNWHSTPARGRATRPRPLLSWLRSSVAVVWPSTRCRGSWPQVDPAKLVHRPAQARALAGAGLAAQARRAAAVRCCAPPRRWRWRRSAPPPRRCWRCRWRCSPAATSRRCPRLYYPARWFLNALRGIDSFVFALLFVAAVGPGPVRRRAGHRAAHLGQRGQALRRAHRERPARAARGGARPPAPGASRRSPTRCCPTSLPVLLSTTLFWWEFNVRASTVLGVVGAGGIGQELKNSMDLLDFSRLFTIIAVILSSVTALDQLERLAAEAARVSSATARGRCVAAARDGLTQGVSRRTSPAHRRGVSFAVRRGRVRGRARRRAAPARPRCSAASPAARARRAARSGSAGIDVGALARSAAPATSRVIFQQFNLVAA